MNLLFEFQNVYLQNKRKHNYEFDNEGLLFHITFKPYAVLRKQRTIKDPIHNRDQTQQIVNDLEHNGTNERCGLNASR